MSDDIKDPLDGEEAVPETTQPDEAELEEDEMAEFDLADYMSQYKAVQSELETAKAANEEAEARLLRLQADFDNYRRRQRLEGEEKAKQAASGLAESLLPVLDNFDRALAAMSESPEKEGVELIAKQLLTILENAGLTEIAALGADFDPYLHQAVLQTEAGEESKNKVTLVLQKGYTFHGKLLRAAMVQVGV